MDGRKSIFELENKLEDPTFEMNRLFGAFFSEERRITHGRLLYNFQKELRENIFPSWPYRDTFISVDEYVNFLGVNRSFDEAVFLNFLEFVYNICVFAEKKMGYTMSDSVLKAVVSNVPKILAKMSCEFRQEDDKYIIIKKSADVDSVIQYVPEQVADLLLAYGDFRIEKDVKAKQTILKKLDLYIEKNKKKLSGYDNRLYRRTQQIVNKLGVNHPSEPPYDKLNECELLEKYDECFTMMTHLLRYDAIKQIEEKTEAFFLEDKSEKS